ncbi:MFS transporter [Neomicrococcus lactis]
MSQDPPVNSAHEAEEPMSQRQILKALTGVLASFFAAMVSITIISIALPRIMEELGGDQTAFAWMITATLLANAASTPIWGKLADLFNKKMLLQVSILIFVVGSVLAGLAASIPLLLGARVIQGLGIGGLMALGMAVIGTMIPPRDRGKYSGYFGGVMAVSNAGGPLLGGLLVDSPLGWRASFWAGVPVCLIAMFLIQRTLHLKHVRRPVTIDWIGASLVTVIVSLLLIWASYVGKAGYFNWVSVETLWMVGGSILLIFVLIRVAKRAADPVIPLRIITQRTPALAILASIGIGIGMFGSGAFLGQYFQVAQQATPTMAGILTLPMIAGNLLGSVVSGQLISRYGRWKPYLVAGSIMNVLALSLLGTMNANTPYWILAVGMFVNGIGMGMMLQNLVLAVQNGVKVTEIGTASSSVAFFRTVGGAAGVAVLGSALSSQVQTYIYDGLRSAGIISPDGGGSPVSGASLDLRGLPEPVKVIVEQAFGDATSVVFVIAAAAALMALICVLAIKEVPLRKHL